ncbi:coiled-coil domain-containing protein 103-like [Eriocheir sinensis]|uniref:coiled-coil domain-containing protein 103-like n=1 Tax=Eriocheir sinensis TaxID=95602 RepID=UPI0021C8E0C9|nr:coiled-coil domain-containing protein 103-like [Eriocheir sinensis]XP_050712812.1 coiled-coil domain-containing protein 103-like [Eriocheir sinensis]
MACGGWEGSVDSSQLEARLRVGLEADRRYAAENSAKLRGIHSAPTYEEFRQLVLGAHLKPLDRNDKSKVKPSIWNSFASTATKKTSKSPPQDMENSVYPTDVHYDVNNPPNTSEGLVQLWERLDLAERLELLRNLSPQATEKLAGGLVAGGLLGDAITTLLAFTPTVSDVVMVVNMLHALTLAKRFSLSVTLVCGEERWAWGRLLEKLQLALSERPQDLAEMNVTEWTLAQLKLKFNL